ncbi:hypothetical protein ANN_03626 [Periplaneta americana]|uniref:Uncharacterized protein n=1 Tax=Periplaneta americana TaxID=6978 RepID=A0ABQ8TZK0_PERAM|nr:hypothetical protein ANN_03626 [Periplaneta americana]
MAGLCEGGNEPAGSLKGIFTTFTHIQREREREEELCNRLIHEGFGIHQNSVEIEEDLVAQIAAAAGEVCDNVHDVQWSLVRRMKLCRQGNGGHFEHLLSRKQGIPTEGMQMKHCDKEERVTGKSRDSLNDIEEYSRKRNDIDRISLAL